MVLKSNIPHKKKIPFCFHFLGLHGLVRKYDVKMKIEIKYEIEILCEYRYVKLFINECGTHILKNVDAAIKLKKLMLFFKVWLLTFFEFFSYSLLILYVEKT